MAGSDNEVLFGSGLDLSGDTDVENRLDADGKIYIGSSSGNPQATIPTSTDSAVSIVPGDGTLDIQIGSGVTPSKLIAKGDLLTYYSGAYQRFPVGADNLFLKADSSQPSGFLWDSAGSASPLTTKGDIFTYAAADARLPVGTNGYILSANSSESTGLEWIANTTGTVTSVSGTSNRISSTGGATPVIDIDAAYVGQTSITTLGTIGTGTWQGTTIAVDQGGTGQTSYTDGQLLIGNSTGNTLAKATLTGGTGITVNNGSGTIEIVADNNGTVTSVSGTLNRISSTGGATPVIDIDAAYVGQASITTLGTITTGTWTATDIAVTAGGTGASDAGTARTNLGVAIGSDVQAWDAQLDDIASLAVTDGNFIVGDGANWVAESGSTARTSLGHGS
jgi:hypothetical protein